MLKRWLDPPEVVERKRRLRAAGVRPPRSRTYVEVGLVGCLLPLAAVVAVAIAVGVVIGTRSQAVVGSPREAVVRVIDSGAPGGPQIVSTQVVPLR
jgi:hypothetical protein